MLFTKLAWVTLPNGKEAEGFEYIPENTQPERRQFSFPYYFPDEAHDEWLGKPVQVRFSDETVETLHIQDFTVHGAEEDDGDEFFKIYVK